MHLTNFYYNLRSGQYVASFHPSNFFSRHHTSFQLLDSFFPFQDFLLLHMSAEFFPSSVQFSPVAQSCPTLYDPMNRSTPGLPVHHQPLSKVGSSFSVLNKNGSSSNFPWQIYQLPSPPNISLVSLIGTFHNLLLAPGKGFSGVAVATESVLPLGLFTSSHNIFWPLYLIY